MAGGVRGVPVGYPLTGHLLDCMLGLIHFQSVNKLFMLIFSLNRSTNVSEKIVFRVGKKAEADR